jgi:excisionase family DNA binding protein
MERRMIAVDAAIRALVTEVVREVVREELAKQRPPGLPELVTVDEYAGQRSISVSTVRAAIREGRLSVERIGRAVRVPAKATIARSLDAAKFAAARDARRTRLFRRLCS